MNRKTFTILEIESRSSAFDIRSVGDERGSLASLSYACGVNLQSMTSWLLSCDNLYSLQSLEVHNSHVSCKLLTY